MNKETKAHTLKSAYRSERRTSCSSQKMAIQFVRLIFLWQSGVGRGVVFFSGR